MFWSGAPGLLIGGGRLYIEHGFGTILGAERIGRDCWINQDVTLASHSARGGAIIGDHVFVRMGAKGLGGTVTGDDCEIDANAVVTKNISSGVVAIGVPARVAGKNPRLAVPDTAST